MSSKKSNPVAKFCRQYNKATVQRDRKKDAARGKRKHKRGYRDEQV